MSMNHVNQIAVLSSSGQVANLMRGQGALHHRLLPSDVATPRAVKRQFQHPTFSSDGDYVAFAEMHFTDQGLVRTSVVVWEVPKDPALYGATDSTPVFDSGPLLGAPFLLRFSPDDKSLTMLCSAPPSTNTSAEGGDDGDATALVQLDWVRYSRKDGQGGRATQGAGGGRTGASGGGGSSSSSSSGGGSQTASRFVARKAMTLLRGSPIFFDYTSSSSKNATIVAHCAKAAVVVGGSTTTDDGTDGTSASAAAAAATTPQAGAMEKAVWVLDKQDTDGVGDAKWSKLCDSDPQQRWSAPVCHSAGGGDSVLVVEDGWLVTKALSRWKRDPISGELPSKRLMQLEGQVQFMASPDSSKVVVLQEDINLGLYALKVVDGESALDPASPDTGNIYDLPQDKLTVAFWFSPDSTKVLCLTAAGKNKDDVKSQKSTFRVGLNSDMQWSVYNFPLQVRFRCRSRIRFSSTNPSFYHLVLTPNLFPLSPLPSLQELREYDTFKPTPYFSKTYVPFFSQYGQVTPCTMHHVHAPCSLRIA